MKIELTSEYNIGDTPRYFYGFSEHDGELCEIVEVEFDYDLGKIKCLCEFLDRERKWILEEHLGGDK